MQAPISYKKINPYFPSDLKTRLYDQLVPTQSILKTVGGDSHLQRFFLGIYCCCFFFCPELKKRDNRVFSEKEPLAGQTTFPCWTLLEKKVTPLTAHSHSHSFTRRTFDSHNYRWRDQNLSAPPVHIYLCPVCFYLVPLLPPSKQGALPF